MKIIRLTVIVSEGFRINDELYIRYNQFDWETHPDDNILWRKLIKNTTSTAECDAIHSDLLELIYLDSKIEDTLDREFIEYGTASIVTFKNQDFSRLQTCDGQLEWKVQVDISSTNIFGVSMSNSYQAVVHDPGWIESLEEAYLAELQNKPLKTQIKL